MAAAVHLTLVASDNEKFTVLPPPARLPRRKPNAEYRSREHLTEREVGRLIEVVKGNRWGHRDAATMVLVAFRHGLRASELVDLRWDQVDLEHALLHVRRVKNGSPATHPLTGKELRALRLSWRISNESIRWGPFFFEVPAPANEEVDGTRNRPSPNISIPLHRSIKLGPPVYLP